MKSAQENLERSQRRLAALLGKTNPLFPKAYAKDLADAQNDVAYWTQQAAIEQQQAVNLFAPAPVQQAPQPQIVYYKPPTIPDSTSTTTNTVMAVGAIVAIVAVVAFLRVR